MSIENRSRLPRLIGVALFCLLVLTICASAQEITGRLVGTVVDASAAALPDANVSATNQDTVIVTKTKTHGQGNSVFSTLPPCLYTIRVEANGFRTAAAADSQITVAVTSRGC